MKIKVSIKRTILYILAFAGCLLPAFFMNTLYGYCGILFFVLLSIASLVYGFIISRHVGCDRKSCGNRCFRGEKIPMELEIVNDSIFPTTPCHAEFFTTDLVGDIRSKIETGFTLTAKEKRSFGFNISLDHIGSYSVGLNSIRCETLLGIVSFIKSYTVKETVDVLPIVHDLNTIQLSENVNTESNYSHHVSHTDSVDYTGVREYSFGDPVKLIHWNLSSHSGTYLTKLMESYGNDTLNILISNETKGYGIETVMDVYDAEIEIIASLCNTATSFGLEIDLSFTDNDSPSRESYNHSDDYSDLIHILPRLEKTGKCSHLDELLKAESKQKYGSSNIAVVTSILDEPTVTRIVDIKLRRRNVIVFFIQPLDAEEDRETLKMLRTISSHDIELHVIHSANEIAQEVRA